MANGTLTLGGIQYEVVAVDKTKDGLDSAKANVKDFQKANDDALTGIYNSYRALALEVGVALAGLGEAYNLTIGRAVAYQDQLDTMHNMLGVTIEDAQKWDAAAIATDTDLSSVMTTMRYLTQRISDSGEAGDNLRATLKGIGVDAKDASGKYKDSSELFQEILVALSEIPAGTERASKAADIFGPRWYYIADMINNADTAVKTFENTHATMTDKESERIDKFKVKWAGVTHQIELAEAEAGLFFIGIEEGITRAGELTGVKASAAGMGVAGILDYLKTGNAATMDEALKRLLEPEKYTKSALEEQEKQYKESQTPKKDASDQTDTLSKSTENLFLKMTDLEREIAYQEQVIIPRYTEALKEAERTGKGVTEAQYNLANAIDHLNDLKTQDTDRTKAQTDAYKEYKSAVEDLNDAKEKLYDLDLDYADEMQNAGTDVAAARRATMSYNRQRRGLVGDLGEAQMGVTESATEFNEVKAGTPLEQIKGTDQYDKAQATTIEKIVIENVNLSPDYTANDFMSDLTAGRIAKGVPISR
jgi:hypothetical protein